MVRSRVKSNDPATRRHAGTLSRESAARVADAAHHQRRALAIWLMAFSTLAWVPGGFSRFVVAKLLVVAVACLVGATVPSTSRLPRLVVAMLGAGAALFALAALVGDTPLASLVGRWPRYEGLPVLGMYAASAWLGARLVDNRRRLDALVAAVAGMACTLGAFSALSAIGWSPLGESDLVRDGSLLGNATDQGLVGMMAVAVLARPALETLRELYLFGITGALGTVVLSGSRIAIGLTVVVLLVLALTRRRQLMLPVLGVVAVLAVVVLLAPQARDRLTNTQTVKGRLLAWDLSLDMVGDKPILGFGPSRYVDAVGRYETQEWVDWVGTSTAPDSPHNWILQVWLAGGIPLLLCALALAVVTMRLGLRAVRGRPELAGVFAAVAAYGAAMLANFTIASSTCLAAFLAGVLLTVHSPDRGRGRGERSLDRWTAIAVYSAAACLLLAVCVSEVFLQRGVEQAGLGETEDAGTAFDRAAWLRPADPDADMIAAQAMAALANDRGRVDAAADAEQRARLSLDATPDTYQSQVALGVALMTQEELAEAREVLDAAIGDFPFRPAAYVQRGIVRFGLGDPDGARSDLERARELGDPSAHDVLRQIELQRAG